MNEENMQVTIHIKDHKTKEYKTMNYKMHGWAQPSLVAWAPLDLDPHAEDQHVFALLKCIKKGVEKRIQQRNKGNQKRKPNSIMTIRDAKQKRDARVQDKTMMSEGKRERTVDNEFTIPGMKQLVKGCKNKWQTVVNQWILDGWDIKNHRSLWWNTQYDML